MDRIKETIDELAALNKSQYCELGPGSGGTLSLGLKEKGKNIIAMEAPWANEENISWARENDIPIYLMEFFTGDFSTVKEPVDCFFLAHAIAHFRFVPHILFKKVYDSLPKGGLFYVSTVNGSSFERVVKLFKGTPITHRVTENLADGYKDVVKDYNKTDKKQIWDDWMHVKEYTKPEIENIFIESGFKIKQSFYRKEFSHWKRDLFIKLYPHLSDEIIVVGEKL